jgi:hypothetical protein
MPLRGLGLGLARGTINRILPLRRSLITRGTPPRTFKVLAELLIILLLVVCQYLLVCMSGGSRAPHGPVRFSCCLFIIKRTNMDFTINSITTTTQPAPSGVIFIYTKVKTTTSTSCTTSTTYTSSTHSTPPSINPTPSSTPSSTPTSTPSTTFHLNL